MLRSHAAAGGPARRALDGGPPGGAAAAATGGSDPGARDRRARRRRSGRGPGGAARAAGRRRHLDGEGDGDSSDAVPDLVATLVHQPAQALTLERATVERAARLAPLLFRLQNALAPPAAERDGDPHALDALADATELFGEGTLDAAAWALGDYGVDPERRGGRRPRLAVDQRRRHRRWCDCSSTRSPPPAPRSARRWRSTRRRSTGCCRRRAPPATCELFLTPAPPAHGLAAGPARARRRVVGSLRARAGIRLHRRVRRARRRRARGPAAPAPPRRRLRALARARRSVRPPAPARRRARAVGLAGAQTVDRTRGDGRAGVPAVGAGPGHHLGRRRPGPHGPRSRAAPAPMTPRRTRSSRRRSRACARPPHRPASTACSPGSASTASTRPGRCRWARSPISLTCRAFRSTASWSRPPAGESRAALDARAFRRWRARRRRRASPCPASCRSASRISCCRSISIARRRGATSSGQPRAWEIWPPLADDERAGGKSRRARAAAARRAARTVDRDGRRIEAVVALVDVPDDAGVRAAEARQQRDRGRRRGPAAAPGAAGAGLAHLRALRRRGAARRRPAGRGGPGGARRARRRRDRPLVLHPLRRRARPPASSARARARRRSRARRSLRRAARSHLHGARASGAVTRVENSAYHPEVARFGGHEGAAAALAHLRIRQRSRVRAAGRGARTARSRPRRGRRTTGGWTRSIGWSRPSTAWRPAWASSCASATSSRAAGAHAESAALDALDGGRAARARRRVSRARPPPARGAEHAAGRRPGRSRTCGESLPTACTSPRRSAS